MRRPRRHIPSDIQKEVLIASRRRCCLCFFLDGNKTRRAGQIAHLTPNPSQTSLEDLVYLCLEHHDEFDGSTSQSKGLTPREVRHYRDQLSREFEETGISALGIGELSPLGPSDGIASDPPWHISQLGKPWRFWLLLEGRPELFAFKSPNGCDGVCRIERIDLTDGRTVIICEEIDGNPGMSVTNAIEFIALHLCRQFEIEPNKLVLLEHYDTHYHRDGEWDLVEFAHRSLVDGFDRPFWMTLIELDWRQLGFRPRKRRGKSTREPQSMIVRGRGLRLP